MGGSPSKKKTKVTGLVSSFDDGVELLIGSCFPLYIALMNGLLNPLAEIAGWDHLWGVLIASVDRRSSDLQMVNAFARYWRVVRAEFNRGRCSGRPLEFTAMVTPDVDLGNEESVLHEITEDWPVHSFGWRITPRLEDSNAITGVLITLHTLRTLLSERQYSGREDYLQLEAAIMRAERRPVEEGHYASTTWVRVPPG